MDTQVADAGGPTHREAGVRTLVVIPTYQEAENIADVLARVRAVVPSADVLVVDDNSPDGTGDLAEASAREHGGISVLRRPKKEGLGPAYKAGFAQGLDAGYEVLVEMDADLSHDPSSLPELLGEVGRGADLAIGSRYVPGGSVPGWPRHRLLLSKVANRYASTVLGVELRDITAGFRAYRAEAVRTIGLDQVHSNGYEFQVEMAYGVLRSGGTVVEVPITFRDRTRGTSKMSLHVVGEAIRQVTWWGFRDRVLHRKKVRRRPKADVVP
jgi:glycosyltransferase involved in cell wall biosynthesis